MSIITLKNEFNEDLLACRACLATNRKLYSIHRDEIINAYRNLVGTDVNPYDTLPQYICNYCTILLLKYNTFRDHCKKASNYLEEARISHKNLTTDYLNKFQPYTHHIKSKIKQISINHHDTTETYPNIKIYNNDHFDFNYEDSNNSIQCEPSNEITHSENSEIYTEMVKIKVENDPVTDTPQKYKRKKYLINQETPNRHKRKKYSALNVLEREHERKKYSPLTVFEKEHKRIKILNVQETSELQNKKEKNMQLNILEKKSGKLFETDTNMKEFERTFDVDIFVLSEEQQRRDVLDRKNSSNYLCSPYKCELCFKGYMSADILEKHVLSQHDPSRGSVICEFCQFRYKDRRGLNQHLKSHRLKFSCRQCSYVSRTTFNAKEHFKMHDGQVHECQHCGKSYEKLSSHLSHLRIQHPSEFIWCDVCGEAFIGAFGLNAHKKRAHRYFPLPAACPSCDMHFIDNSALERHSSRGSCSEQTCLHCGEAFKEALQLRDHLLETHRSCKVYTCEKCNKTFSRESLYSAHYRRIHVDSKEKANRKKERPWVCEVCGKTLPNKCVLLYHQRNHTGERPYHCTQCPKSFTMKKLLQSHLRVHTSDRPYTCKLCPKAFKGLSALRTHEHVHTGQTKPTSKVRTLQ